MSIYQFSPTSPISGVTFRYANDRPPVALVAAAPQMGAGQLSTIRRAMQSQGWSAVPAFAEGHNVLQVSGFKEEGELVGTLMALSFTRGTPQLTPEPGDHPTLGWREWLENNSLRVGGVLNLIGDVGLLFSGMSSGRSQEATAGALYTVGGLVAARYGNVRTEYHVREASARLGEYLRDQAIDLPEDCGLYSILNNYRNGHIQKTEDLLYRYPSQTALGAYTFGALAMLQSGMKHGKMWDTAYGVSSVSTKVTSLMVPEKNDEETQKQKQSQNPLTRMYAWMQEKPLRIFGYGSMVTDTLLGISAYREYCNDPRQKSYIFKFLTTGTYLAADLMFAMSSKNGAGKFDEQEQRRIEALAAETIAAQPKGLRAPLVHQVAGFLSQQPEISGSTMELARSLGEQVAQAEKNPWSCRVAVSRSQPADLAHASV